MQREIYENSYKDKKHFSFGKNWQDFLKSLNEERIKSAKNSLINFLGGEENIRGKTFVDIGCGSGLFSLAAHKLGASRVVSNDIDDFSIACVEYLKKEQGDADSWEIKKGSVLDENFLKSLGEFDIVYSWGVLHHTGDMQKAFDNIINLVKQNGLLYLAIYGRSDSRIGVSPELWLKIKKTYNSLGEFGKNVMNYSYVVCFFAASIFLLRNPLKTIRGYKERGMNWHNDVIDWLGGYPYEFAWPEEIINYFGKRKFYCKKIKDRRGLACNEYLFVKKNAE